MKRWGIIALVAVSLLAMRSLPKGIGAEDSAETKKQHEIDLRYARARLEMAQLELKLALQLNKRIPGTLQGDNLTLLEHAVRLAQSQLDALEYTADAKKNPWLQLAELEASDAADALRKAEAANQVAPGTIGNDEILRRKLAVQIAQLRVERAKMLKLDSPMARMQWEVSQLREMVEDLLVRTARVRKLN